MSGLTDEQRRRMEENKRKALERLQKSKSSPKLGPPSTSSSSRPETSVRRNIASFYNDKNNDNDPSNNSVTDKQRTKVQENKINALEKLKQKTSFKTPVSEHSNNTSTSSSCTYPKGYFSPPKSNVTTGPKIYLTLSMKNATWFKVDHNLRHRDAIQKIAQKIERRQFDATCGQWNFHITDYQTTMKAFETEGNISVDPVPENVVKILQRAHHNNNVQNSSNEAELSNIEPEILGKLMDFQKDGVKFGIKRKGRLLIADDMGLGKTVQAISLCSYYRNEWPVLVICPSSVKMSWQQHFTSWISDVDEEDINIVNTGKDDPTSGKINIISYDLASKLVGKIYRKQFKIIVADECHFLKNHAAQRTQNIVPLLQVTRHAILLSGTPALSRPKELFTQIKALDKTLFPQYHEFSKRYCAGRQTPYGWDDSGCSNDAELQAVLSSTLMVRRMKDDVLHQLPEKRRQIVLLDPSLIKNVRALVSEERMFREAKEDKRSALLNYFQKTCESKIKGVREYIAEKIECGAKIIVFAHHIMMLDAIEETAVLKKIEYIRIDGGTNQKSRQSKVDQFNNEPNCILAILSLTACGTGLNITGSSNVVFAELYWNPGHLKQAEDRAYRIGQKNCVLVTYLVANKTADDYIWPMVQSKLKVLTNLGVGTEQGFEGKTTKQDACRQKSMMDFFEKLIEDDDQDFVDQIDKMQEQIDKQESQCKLSGEKSIISDDAKQILENGTVNDDILSNSKKSIISDDAKQILKNDLVNDDILSDLSSDPLDLDGWISDDLTPDDLIGPVHKKSKIS